jgi:hypothetical protein
MPCRSACRWANIAAISLTLVFVVRILGICPVHIGLVVLSGRFTDSLAYGAPSQVSQKMWFRKEYAIRDLCQGRLNQEVSTASGVGDCPTKPGVRRLALRADCDHQCAFLDSASG